MAIGKKNRVRKEQEGASRVRKEGKLVLAEPNRKGL